MSKQRLIDANALREHWHISEKCEECHWNNRDCSKPPYYSLHDICEAIDEVSTIDAIPVEWLKNLQKDERATLDDVESIDWILVWWQQEQEEG